MSRTHCQVVCLAACLVVSLACASPAAAGQKLRIMTFNVENLAAPHVRVRLERYRFNIGRRVHLERVAAVIEAFEPDIVNLVEVTSREAVDQLVEILHQKGLKDYQGHHVESADTFTGFDVAVIARHKPDEVAGATIRLFHSRVGERNG
jgi:endonuclease/exonuclease/phosphatase family metal-dependent hydrolase